MQVIKKGTKKLLSESEASEKLIELYWNLKHTQEKRTPKKPQKERRS